MRGKLVEDPDHSRMRDKEAIPLFRTFQETTALTWEETWFLETALQIITLNNLIICMIYIKCNHVNLIVHILNIFMDQLMNHLIIIY